jgi:hypothetical protein
MMDIDRFPEHLESLNPADWQRLFDLLPEIRRTREFQRKNENDEEYTEEEDDGSLIIHLPNYFEIPLLCQFRDVVDELQIMPAFNWVDWEEGVDLILGIRDGSGQTHTLDLLTLCKLLTVIFRKDRFCDGTLADCFTEGIIERILEGMKKKVEEISGNSDS